jgi:hypothetical protein
MGGKTETWHEKLEEFSRVFRISTEERRSAKATINCLRQGSPPQEDVAKITVGMEGVRPLLANRLQIAKSGGSAFTLVNGVYGSGKSHCLCLLREMAFHQGCLVSFVTLSPRECPLCDLGAVYARIAQSIEGRSRIELRSLQDVIESWAVRMRTCKGYLEQVRHAIRTLHADFRIVLSEYFSGSSDRAEMAGRWLIGDDSTKQTAKALNVQLRATDEFALIMLNELGKLGRAIGFGALVVLLDEAEAIPSYRGSSRQAHCYENLGRVIEKSGRVPYCYFVYATTPMFFDKCHGRVPISETSEAVLQIPPLLQDNFVQLGRIVRDLYVVGESWQGQHRFIDDDQVEQCVAKYAAAQHWRMKPRGFVRSLVAALDICATNREQRLSEVFSLVQD